MTLLLGAGALAAAIVAGSLGLRRRGVDRALACVLAATFAWGIWGMAKLALLLAGAPPVAARLAGVALAGAAIAVARRAAPPLAPGPGERRFAPPLVWALLALSVVVGACVLLEHGHRYPEGDWDAWGIWNVKARFLLRGGVEWRRLLTVVGGLHHPGYPLLLPISVASGWRTAGAETAVVPALIAVASGAASVAIVGLAAARLRGAASGAVAAALLLTTPRFLTATFSQLADVPAGLFLAAACALAAIAVESPPDARWRPLLVAAGAMAAIGPHVKNEGTLGLAALGAALAIAPAARSRAAVAWYVLGTLPALALLAWFKRSAPAVDLFVGTWPDVLARARQPGRVITILLAFAREPLRVGSWALTGAALVATIAAGCAWRRPRGAAPVLIATLAVLAAGYGAVYLVTPHPLQMHLDFSLDRLVAGAWPAAVLAAVLVLPPIGGAPPRHEAFDTFGRRALEPRNSTGEEHS